LKVLQLILSIPIAFLYGIALRLRNFAYDIGILKSYSFSSISIISIGNLSFGGTGKTPHVEYLIHLFLSQGYQRHEIATLSRGYGRKTKGFLLVENNHSSEDVGDEPLQFKHKFLDIPVAVDENRKHGIEQLLTLFPDIRVVLLDDAFQHRQIKADLSILLTDSSNLFVDDYLFPIGTLREPQHGSKRADIIVVTKGSKFISPLEQRSIRDKISPKIHQRVFFSFMEYLELKRIAEVSETIDLKSIIQQKFSVLLVTGIAKSSDLEYYLKDSVYEFIHLKYPDHYVFSSDDVQFIQQKFASIQNLNKIIITTEKDSKRLLNKNILNTIYNLPVYYLPIKITFAGKDEGEFNKIILDYVRRNKVNSDILKK
jgi:tetraacyldisaccharide 4'-kinase